MTAAHDGTRLMLWPSRSLSTLHAENDTCEERECVFSGYVMRPTSFIPDREHTVSFNREERLALLKWLENPNGAHRINSRLVFESVEGGGAWVRTQPYRESSPS